MANINRLVLNTSHKDNEVCKVFDSLELKYNGLTGSIPCPNQAFATSYNDFGEPTKLIFTEYSYQQFKQLRDIAHRCSVYQSSMSKEVNQIKFACIGYKDLDGDIVITKIECPVLEKAFNKNFKTDSKFIDFVSKESGKSEYKLEANARAFDHLRNSVFHKEKPIGREIVAFIGYTKDESNPETNNCFKLSEVADAVLPNIPVNTNKISCGVIAITPKTLNASAIYNKKNRGNLENLLQDGSLECAIISCEKSQNTGCVTPTSIKNIRACVGMNKNTEEPITISSSKQPLEKLYIASSSKNNDGHSM